MSLLRALFRLVASPAAVLALLLSAPQPAAAMGEHITGGDRPIPVTEPQPRPGTGEDRCQPTRTRQAC